MTRLPRRLGTQPLVESLIEVRIGSAREPMPDVVPGLVFSKLADRFNRTEVLPLASLPRDLRESNPLLKFQAYHRLLGDKFVLSVGDRVIALSRLAPYGGWDDFKGTIVDLLTVLEDSELVEQVVRYSMKSLNIIPAMTERQLDMIELTARLNDEPLPDHGFTLRTELNDERWVRIVEVAPNTRTVSRSGGQFEGLRLNVDCIRGLDGGGGTLATVREGLEELHEECKKLFFSILTEQTLKRLDPEYDD